MLSRGVCIAGMAQKRSVYITFGPRTARIEEPFYVPCPLLISPQARCHPS